MPSSKPAIVSLVCLSLVAALAGVATGCAGSLDRAQEAIAVGDEATAEAELRKALTRSSTEKEAAVLLAVLLADQGNELAADDPKSAEERFREALELDPRNEEARLGLARLLMKRGFTADARELLSVEECHGCGRLIAIMVHEQAVKALQAGEIESARASFQEAWDLGADPVDALGLAETYLVAKPPDLEQAKTWLETVAPLIARGQVNAENKFRDLRARLLTAAAAARNNDMVEAAFGLRTAELEEEPEFDLRFEISQEQFRQGDSDPAIARLSNLLQNSGQYLEDTQREVMGAAIVIMYSARAAQHLQAGDPAGAAKDIAAGLKLDADNSRLKLQQILAIAANGRLPLAFKQLQEAGKGNDRDQVEAILWTMEALSDIDAGKNSRAEDDLAKAERLAAELPEVHVVKAYLAADERTDVLRKDDMRDARQLGQVDYPGGRINAYPTALAHLARAKQLVEKQGVLHPWRGGGFDKRVKDLEAKLAFYPYEVEWYAGKGGMIELLAEGGQKEVEFSGPRWLKGTAIAAPDNSAEIEVPNTGLVTLELGDKQIAVVVEDGTHIKVKI